MGSLLDGVPEALSALERATRISERAAAAGFDWSRIEEIRAKITEELLELDSALADAHLTATPAVIEEFGDLLVALVNLSRHLQFDAEAALRAASRKFEQRFRHMEASALAKGCKLTSLTAAEWDDLWREAKRSEVFSRDSLTRA